MDVLKVYYTNHVVKKIKRSIKLHRCGCGIVFDVCSDQFNVMLKSHEDLGPHELPEIKIRGRCTFLTNPKSNKLFTQCERCRNDQRKYRYENKEKEKARHQLYNSKPERKEKRKLKDMKYRSKPENKEKIKTRQAEYTQRPEIKARQAEYRQRPEVKARKRKYNSKPVNKEKRNAYQRNRHQTNITVRVRSNLSRALNRQIRKIIGGCLPGKDTIAHLGCCMEHFVKHIEDQFEEGMTWENYGRPKGLKNEQCWQIDHDTPARFNENGEEITVDDILERSHYTNFQPMWAPANQSKGNRFKGRE